MKFTDLKDNVVEIVSAVIGIFGVIFAIFFFKNKAESAEAEALVAKTKGEDKQLKKQQDKVKQEINKVKAQDDSNLTPEERAERWEK